MKIVVLGICLATLALGACRRESPEYQPMNSGRPLSTRFSNNEHKLEWMAAPKANSTWPGASPLYCIGHRRLSTFNRRRTSPRTSDRRRSNLPAELDSLSAGPQRRRPD